MVFSSAIFLFVFLPIVCALYFIVPGIKGKNTLLIIASLIFYAFGEPIYVLLMIGSIIANYIFGLMEGRFSKANNIAGKKIVLIIAVICNIGVLCVFKYTAFILENINYAGDAIVNFKGGELTFDSPLNGKEYSRVTQALYCGEDDLFYAIVNVPMTENNQSVSSVTKNITDIKEQTIVKCIILLYPAEGINEQGDIDDQGYVKNLEDLKNPLATMNEDKKSTVLEMQQASEEILNKVVSDMPKEYGKKQAIDYFLDWMDKNLILDSDTMENTDKLSNMTEVFEKNYFEGCTSCVVDGKAVATGYSKVLTRLCNKAGISAHMTIGSWKYSGSYTLVNVDFEGKQVYIDASGCKKDDLWNQRYISDTLMARNMTISDLFNDEK